MDFVCHKTEMFCGIIRNDFGLHTKRIDDGVIIERTEENNDLIEKQKTKYGFKYELDNGGTDE